MLAGRAHGSLEICGYFHLPGSQLPFSDTRNPKESGFLCPVQQFFPLVKNATHPISFMWSEKEHIDPAHHHVVNIME